MIWWSVQQARVMQRWKNLLRTFKIMFTSLYGHISKLRKNHLRARCTNPVFANMLIKACKKSGQGIYTDIWGYASNCWYSWWNVTRIKSSAVSAILQCRNTCSQSWSSMGQDVVHNMPKTKIPWQCDCSMVTNTRAQQEIKGRCNFSPRRCWLANSELLVFSSSRCCVSQPV